MNEQQRILSCLHQKACTKVEACLSPGDVEAEMSAFLDAALAYPEERKFVLGLFEKELRTDSRATYEFLEFYIHGLRWPELLALIEAEWYAHPEDRRRLLKGLQHLREAFDDNWEGAEFYKRFTR